jgi:hypothetical protein
MSDRRPDNGGTGSPDDGGRGLPDLPPEWGTVVIPDDPAELASEAEALRRELRTQSRRRRLRRLMGLRATTSGETAPSTLGAPVVIMTIAILTTILSLLVVTWGTPPGSLPGAQSSASDTAQTAGTANGPPAPITTGTQPTTSRAVTSTGTTSPAGVAATPDLTTPLTDLRLLTAAGRLVRIGDVLPVVILLVDGCLCDALISGVAAAAPAGVRVLAVAAGTVPSGSASGVTWLDDPGGSLYARFFSSLRSPPSHHANVLEIASSGAVSRTIPYVARVGDVTPIVLR